MEKHSVDIFISSLVPKPSPSETETPNCGCQEPDDCNFDPAANCSDPDQCTGKPEDLCPDDPTYGKRCSADCVTPCKYHDTCIFNCDPDGCCLELSDPDFNICCLKKGCTDPLDCNYDDQADCHDQTLCACDATGGPAGGNLCGCIAGNCEYIDDCDVCGGGIADYEVACGSLTVGNSTYMSCGCEDGTCKYFDACLECFKVGDPKANHNANFECKCCDNLDYCNGYAACSNPDPAACDINCLVACPGINGAECDGQGGCHVNVGNCGAPLWVSCANANATYGCMDADDCCFNAQATQSDPACCCKKKGTCPATKNVGSATFPLCSDCDATGNCLYTDNCGECKSEAQGDFQEEPGCSDPCDTDYDPNNASFGNCGCGGSVEKRGCCPSCAGACNAGSTYIWPSAHDHCDTSSLPCTDCGGCTYGGCDNNCNTDCTSKQLDDGTTVCCGEDNCPDGSCPPESPTATETETLGGGVVRRLDSDSAKAPCLSTDSTLSINDSLDLVVNSSPLESIGLGLGAYQVIANNWDYFAVISNTPCIQFSGDGLKLSGSRNIDGVNHFVTYFTGFFDINVLCDFGSASLVSKNEVDFHYQGLLFQSTCGS